MNFSITSVSTPTWAERTLTFDPDLVQARIQLTGDMSIKSAASGASFTIASGTTFTIGRGYAGKTLYYQSCGTSFVLFKETGLVG